MTNKPVGPHKGEPCLLAAGKICDICGECSRCDLDPRKICTNCCQCLGDADYRAVVLTEVLWPENPKLHEEDQKNNPEKPKRKQKRDVES